MRERDREIYTPVFSHGGVTGVYIDTHAMPTFGVPRPTDCCQSLKKISVIVKMKCWIQVYRSQLFSKIVCVYLYPLFFRYWFRKLKMCRHLRTKFRIQYDTKLIILIKLLKKKKQTKINFLFLMFLSMLVSEGNTNRKFLENGDYLSMYEKTL